MCEKNGTEIDVFLITMSLYQGSTLSLYLFAYSEEIPWCMLFIVDIVLIEESREWISPKVERQKQALKSKGFTISRTLRKYMHYSFSRIWRRNENAVQIDSKDISHIC